MNSQKFYVNNYSYLTSEDDINIEFVPSVQKRRLNKLAKATFTTLNKCFNDDITDIIFSSKYGELLQLDKLINQYTNENELSPALFSYSLHNSIIGLFAHLKNYKFSYSAQSASESTISSAFLSAIISPSKNKLFCYSDNDSELISLCVSISAEQQENTIFGCKLSFFSCSDIIEKDEWSTLLSFLTGEKSTAKFSLYKIERI